MQASKGAEALGSKRGRNRRFESKLWNRLKGEVRGSEIGLETSCVAGRKTVGDDLIGPVAIDVPRCRIEEVAGPAPIGKIAELVGHRQDRVSHHRPVDHRPRETTIETHEGGQIESGDWPGRQPVAKCRMAKKTNIGVCRLANGFRGKERSIVKSELEREATHRLKISLRQEH